MILDSYESPTRGLSYAVPFVSIFKVFYRKYERSLTLNSDQPVFWSLEGWLSPLSR